jgi:hypothetical protein
MLDYDVARNIKKDCGNSSHVTPVYGSVHTATDEVTYSLGVYELQAQILHK